MGPSNLPSTTIHFVEPFVAGKPVDCRAAGSWDEAVRRAAELASTGRFDFVHAVEQDGGARLLRVRSEPEGLEIAFDPDAGLDGA